MNKVILMGRLTRDPEVRYTNNANGQMAVARFTLAVDRRGRKNAQGNEQTADFISCVAFGAQGEFAEKYLRKGTRMVVCGRIQTGSYTNKDGVRVYTTDVIVEELEFAESKASASSYNGGQDSFGGNQSFGGSNNYGGNQNYGGYGNQGSNRPAPASAIGDDFMNIPEGVDDEGLPFN